MNTATKKSNLNNVSFHTLRHTFASLKLQGVNTDGTKRPPVRIEIIAEILGHRSIDLTKKVYAQFDNNTLLEIL